MQKKRRRQWPLLSQRDIIERDWLQRCENAKGRNAEGNIPLCADYSRQCDGWSLAGFLKVTHPEQHVCRRQYQEKRDVFFFFLSALSAVSLNWWIPLHKSGCVSVRPGLPWGAAGPRVRSMGLNGSQRETEGCGGSFALASSREKKPRGTLPILYRQAQLYLVLSILTPLHSFSNCANTKEKEEKSISISE